MGVQGEYRAGEHWSFCFGYGGIPGEFSVGTLGARWLPSDSGNMYFQAMGGLGATYSDAMGFNSLTVGSASRWKPFALDANIGIMLAYQEGLMPALIPSLALGIGRNIAPR